MHTKGHSIVIGTQAPQFASNGGLFIRDLCSQISLYFTLIDSARPSSTVGGLIR